MASGRRSGASPDTGASGEARVQPSAAGQDQRTHDRQVIVSFVWCIVLETERLAGDAVADGTEDLGTWQSIARSCNISEGGIGLIMTRPLDAGRLVMLEIGLTHTHVSAVAKVAWSRRLKDERHEVGVKFLAIPPKDRIELRAQLRGRSGGSDHR